MSQECIQQLLRNFLKEFLNGLLLSLPLLFRPLSYFLQQRWSVVEYRRGIVKTQEPKPSAQAASEDDMQSLIPRAVWTLSFMTNQVLVTIYPSIKFQW